MLFNELVTLISNFNKTNKVKPGSKTYVHITGISYYSEPAENGATIALHFIENTFGREFTSTFEFRTEENLITYLKQHS